MHARVDVAFIPPAFFFYFERLRGSRTTEFALPPCTSIAKKPNCLVSPKWGSRKWLISHGSLRTRQQDGELRVSFSHPAGPILWFHPPGDKWGIQTTLSLPQIACNSSGVLSLFLGAKGRTRSVGLAGAGVRAWWLHRSTNSEGKTNKQPTIVKHLNRPLSLPLLRIQR